MDRQRNEDLRNELKIFKFNDKNSSMRKYGQLLDAIEGTKGLGKTKIKILADLKKTRSYGDLKDTIENRPHRGMEFRTGV